MSRLLPVAFAVLLVLAGCNGTPDTAESSPVPADRSPTPTPVDEATTGTTSTAGGAETLPTNATLVFDRIENLTGLRGRPPRRVVVKDPSELETIESQRSTLERYLGFSPVEFRSHAYAVPSPAPGRVTLSAGMPPDRTEVTLVHELYHILWFQHDFSVYENRRNVTTQTLFLTVTIAEGAAVFVQQRYWSRYMPPGSFEPAAKYRREYHDGTPMRRTTSASYYFGYRYLAHRLDSARNLTAVFANPPRTTEELIHELPPGSEPPTALSIDGRSGAVWSLDPRVEPDAAHLERHVAPDTKGELFVRHALQAGVNDTAAARAADGWGNDGMLAYQRANDGARGFVWTIRFDDSSNASEFESVFIDYLSNRGRRDGSFWAMGDVEGVTFRMITVDERTVTLVFGPRPFTANTSVSAANGPVVVEVP